MWRAIQSKIARHFSPSFIRLFVSFFTNVFGVSPEKGASVKPPCSLDRIVPPGSRITRSYHFLSAQVRGNVFKSLSLAKEKHVPCFWSASSFCWLPYHFDSLKPTGTTVSIINQPSPKPHRYRKRNMCPVFGAPAL